MTDRETEFRKEHNLLQTYLRKRGYLVSTGYRQCSAMGASDIWYYETLVWTWDEETRKSDRLVWSTDAGSHPDKATKSHLETCAKLSLHGHERLDDNDDE